MIVCQSLHALTCVEVPNIDIMVIRATCNESIIASGECVYGTLVTVQSIGALARVDVPNLDCFVV